MVEIIEDVVGAAWSGCDKLKLSDNFDALVAVTIVLLACFDPSFKGFESVFPSIVPSCVNPTFFGAVVRFSCRIGRMLLCIQKAIPTFQATAYHTQLNFVQFRIVSFLGATLQLSEQHSDQAALQFLVLCCFKSLVSLLQP